MSSQKFVFIDKIIYLCFPLILGIEMPKTANGRFKKRRKI